MRRLFGAEVAAKLQAHYGGIRAYIPKDPKPHNVLTHLVGIDVARAIAKHWGGMTIDVASGDEGRNRTWRRVEELLLSGASAAKAARAAGCTERTVYKVRARLKDLGRLP